MLSDSALCGMHRLGLYEEEAMLDMEIAMEIMAYTSVYLRGSFEGRIVVFLNTLKRKP